ncbi:hypothetical protein OESDEN_14061 [Oesophagostomum dentatum]|uniref:NHL repeat protein n=1 Tax=Oesophagostomum dentatum TaxID=61180 RepID=A0A0B1SRS0_OESDE|nr:hypothetical protein OESDEN_14061 [Oesophagostomum dentatum]
MHLGLISEDDLKRSISSVGEYDGLIWVHIRNHAVILLGQDSEVQKTLTLGHCGYCRTVLAGDILVYPDNVIEEHFLRFVQMSSGDRGRAILKQLPLSLISVDNSIFVGDEAGTVTRFSLQGKEEAQVSLFKEPVFSLAGTSTTLACGSSKPPLLLLETANLCAERRKIDYPQRQVYLHLVIE